MASAKGSAICLATVSIRVREFPEAVKIPASNLPLVQRLQEI